MKQFAVMCEVAGIRIRTSKSEAMILDRKRMESSLLVRDKFKWSSLSILGSCLQVRREWSKPLTDRQIEYAVPYRSVIVKRTLRIKVV